MKTTEQNTNVNETLEESAIAIIRELVEALEAAKIVCEGTYPLFNEWVESPLIESALSKTNNKKLNVMNTEPVGFKGSVGVFEIDQISPVTFGKAIVCGENYIAHIPKCNECEPNAKLLKASKKMAIALQNMLSTDLWKKHMAGGKFDLQAKEALKEAGL